MHTLAFYEGTCEDPRWSEGLVDSAWSEEWDRVPPGAIDLSLCQLLDQAGDEPADYPELGALPKGAVRELQYWQHRIRRGRAAKGGAGAAFSEVYATKAWGDDGTDFYSGPGTIEQAVTVPYLDFLRAEFAAMPAPPRVLDLGCGDFKICSQLLPSVGGFTGVDVVPELVEPVKAFATALISNTPYNRRSVTGRDSFCSVSQVIAGCMSMVVLR